MEIPVEPVTEEDGETVFNLATDELNDDWINSSRLSEREKREKEKRQLYMYVEDEVEGCD